ncbi:MAG: DsbA family protein, partial [Cellulophaga sp.]
MNKKIKIDVVSDVVCPWCAIGYKRLEQAINELNIKDKIELEWQPFELNPN